MSGNACHLNRAFSFFFSSLFSIMFFVLCIAGICSDPLQMLQLIPYGTTLKVHSNGFYIKIVNNRNAF